MKRKLGICIGVFLVLQLIKVFLIQDYGEDFGTSRIAVLLEKGGLGYNQVVCTEDYEKLLPIMISEPISMGVEHGEKVFVMGTSFNYEQLEKLEMVDGAFFGKEAEEEGRKVIVISDELAIKLFGSIYGVDNTIRLGQQTYQIVGVYKKYNRLRDYLLDDGHERVFVPIKSEVVQNTNLKEFILDGTYVENPITSSDVEGFGIYANGSNISDQSKWIKKTRSLCQLPLVVLWFILAVIGLKRLSPLIKAKEEIKYKAIKVSIYLVIMGVLMPICFYSLYVDPSGLPAENIFDVGFYWNNFKEEWIRHNVFIAGETFHFEKAYYLLNALVHLMNLAQIGLIIKCIGLKRNRV